jgi:SNF2 family DNA or RNA helicase
MKFAPHNYQSYSIDRIVDDRAIALFLQMGLGKTIVTLTAIEKLMYDTLEVNKVLIVAPLRVAEHTWPDEIAKWSHLSALTFSKVMGDERKRRKALKEKADIYIINRENVPWLVQEVGVKKWDFDMVVLDELSSFKSGKSQRFRALKKVRPLISRVVGLTGTPAPNGLEDLWSQMYLIDQGERLGKTLTGFREQYLVPSKYGPQMVYEWKARPDSEKKVYDKISDVAISMSAEDWLEMPEMIPTQVIVQMPDKARIQYERLEEDLLLSFSEGEIVAQSAAVLSNKLLQMANGAAYSEDGSIINIHDAKLDALEDILESAAGQPILLFYTYKHDIIRLQARFPQLRLLRKGKDGKTDMDDWNEGKIPLLACHPASAGHGLNLQYGGNHIVWFGLTWSLELYEQANARLYRQGQNSNVIIQHLVTADSMDENVIAALENKAVGQNALMAAVKAKIERVKSK